MDWLELGVQISRSLIGFLCVGMSGYYIFKQGDWFKGLVLLGLSSLLFR